MSRPHRAARRRPRAPYAAAAALSTPTMRKPVRLRDPAEQIASEMLV